MKTKLQIQEARLVKLTAWSPVVERFFPHQYRGLEVWGRPERLPSLFPRGDRVGGNPIPMFSRNVVFLNSNPSMF